MPGMSWDKSILYLEGRRNIKTYVPGTQTHCDRKSKCCMKRISITRLDGVGSRWQFSGW